MTIPNEAWVAAHNVADADLDEVLRAAAPHIARSAQVAVLREVVAELRRASWTSADPAEAEVAKGVALAIGRTIERKANELEAGDV